MPITAGQVALFLILATAVAILTAQLVGPRLAVVAIPAKSADVAVPRSGRVGRARSSATAARTGPAVAAADLAGASARGDAAAPSVAAPATAARDERLATPASGSPRPDTALSDVSFVAEAHGPQVRACYDRVFRHDPAAPTGRIELSFAVVAVGEFGRAVEIQSELNLLGSPIVEHCLIELVSEWAFPRPRPQPDGLPPPRLRYPFVFTAAP